MKIKSIKSVGKRKVYDLSVEEVEHYILENGVVTHNTGIYYSASTIWIIGRRQTKTGTEVTGYDFVINVEKSRYVKEKSKIPISVSWDGGIETYSGLLEVALAGGHVIKPSNGWYQRNIIDTKTGEIIGVKCREKETRNKEFWIPILEDQSFVDFVSKQYKIGLVPLVDFDEIIGEENA